MKNIGLMKHFIGMQVKQKLRKMFISQEKYTDDLLKKFPMKDCKPLAQPMVLNKKVTRQDVKEKVDETIYQSLVELLIYLTNTRPDMVHAASIVSRYMSKPNKAHFSIAKIILRYMKGIKTFSIFYELKYDSNLIGYTDSDWVGNVDDCKSTSGYMFFLGSNVIS